MNSNTEHPLSPKQVIKALVNNKVMSKDQAIEIIGEKEKIRRRLEDARAKNGQSVPGSLKIANPVTIVDVIVARKMMRADKPELELDEDIIFQILAKQWEKPYKKIDPLSLDLNLVTTTIPKNFAMKHLLLPIAVFEGSLVVATSDPFNPMVIEDISRVAHMPVSIVVTAKTDIIRLINEFFGFKRSIAAAESMFSSPIVDLGNLEQYVRLQADDELPANDHHIVNAVNHLFNYAFEQRASDIHIEPKREVVLVRMRIDGVLHTVYRLPKKVHSAIVSRIKNLSRLDMAEKRRPQDGRIKTDKGDVEVEIRISTIPVGFGEKVVMRVMDPDILFQDLDKLGFSDNDLERYMQMVNRPNGMVLVCGPTGSGKSTTLYSTLRRISTPEVNVTTIEDPIEMIHEDFNQISVQPSVDITFASILRNILRQDPDIIMVGELRDLDTSRNAIQAALTGHLVLSTLHTNDAPSSVVRLLDIGIPSFLVQATLTGVISQRLVRKICPRCRESYEIETSELEKMGLDAGEGDKATLYRGKGCMKCRGTGYFGRTAILEVMPYSKALKGLTRPDADLDSIRKMALAEGMVTLRENAMRNLLSGMTTIEEVLRVTWEQE
ncbi:MAG: type II/IV secretion system protein [Deltaproteobacteria bacterium]|nr:type II/IV secretion system protein [Deltaproteobacteria bacterium]